MLHFICMGSAELWEMRQKRKFQNENICPHQELNQHPLTFQPGALDHLAIKAYAYKLKLSLGNTMISIMQKCWLSTESVTSIQ